MAAHPASIEELAMAHVFIHLLREGMTVQQYFVVRQVEERLTQYGKPYLNLQLGDASGVIRAKLWSEALREYPGPFQVGDYVGVVGVVRTYQGEPEITIQKIWTLEQIKQKKELVNEEPKDFDLSLLHATTPYDRQAMWQELLGLARDHLTPPLQDLVINLLEGHAPLWQCQPAARRNHHAYIGGLLEHTLSVARLARQIAAVYPDIHQELVLAGAILHDVGKLKELGQPHAPDYTVAGQLLGHIVLGWDMIRQEAAHLNFSDEKLLLQLEHIVLTHHGQQEFGSPVLPKTREALLVYYADDLDAKLKIMAQHLQADTSPREFTPYHRLLQRELYKIGRETEPAAETENFPEE
jgi:3'-5' exoribonuclease